MAFLLKASRRTETHLLELEQNDEWVVQRGPLHDNGMIAPLGDDPARGHDPRSELVAAKAAFPSRYRRVIGLGEGVLARNRIAVCDDCAFI